MYGYGMGGYGGGMMNGPYSRGYGYGNMGGYGMGGGYGMNGGVRDYMIMGN